jgi:hypothetical protein
MSQSDTSTLQTRMSTRLLVNALARKRAYTITQTYCLCSYSVAKCATDITRTIVSIQKARFIATATLVCELSVVQRKWHVRCSSEMQ